MVGDGRARPRDEVLGDADQNDRTDTAERHDERDPAMTLAQERGDCHKHDRRDDESTPHLGGHLGDDGEPCRAVVHREADDLVIYAYEAVGLANGVGDLDDHAERDASHTEGDDYQPEIRTAPDGFQPGGDVHGATFIKRRAGGEQISARAVP